MNLIAEEAKTEQHQRPKKEQASVTSIIRIAGKDVNGSLNIERALDQVKGIGANLSHALSVRIESKLGIPKSTNIGSLSEEQIASIEALIKDPMGADIPAYMLNRNKDMETNKTIHNVSNDLIFSIRQDINRDVSLRDWRGFRHQYGQKVRGQHTRSTGRTGVTVGVTKKAVIQAQKEARAKPGEKKKEEKK